MGVLITILLPSIIGILIFLLWKHFETRKKFSGIHSPRSYPLIGHLFIIKPDVQGFIDQIMAVASMYTTEPRMVTLWAGPIPILMIYSAKLLEPIFNNPKHFNKPFLYDMLLPWLGYGLLTSPVEKWRGRRKLLTPTFHYDILKNFVFIFQKQSEILIQQLKKVIESGEKEIEVSKYVALCALDIICETSMGKCVNAQLEADSDYVKAVYRINDIIQNRQKNALVWSDLTFKLFGEKKEHDWALSVLHGFTKKVIDERRDELSKEKQEDIGRLAFLDLLLHMEEKGEITATDIQMEVDTFMFEGHDTTSTGISWALHLLGNHPEIQEKVVKEIEEVLGDSEEVSYEHLSKLKYLECVIKESLRLQPSVPMFARVLGDDQNIGGFDIPKGTQILINPYLIHRDPTYWDDAEKFIPERFFPENLSKRHPFAFVPFSAGSRNCIGQRFAIMEEKTVLANILRSFKIKSTKRRDQLGFKTELILRPIDGIYAALGPRTGG